MDIVVPHKIRKKELGGEVSEEARKLFAKLKEKPELAAGISSPERRIHEPAEEEPQPCTRGHCEQYGARA